MDTSGLRNRRPARTAQAFVAALQFTTISIFRISATRMVINYRVPAPVLFVSLFRLLTSLYISRQVSHST